MPVDTCNWMAQPPDDESAYNIEDLLSDLHVATHALLLTQRFGLSDDPDLYLYGLLVMHWRSPSSRGERTACYRRRGKRST